MPAAHRPIKSFLPLILALALCLAIPAHTQEPGNPPPTFTKDVAPILQKHCQTCHRPGEAAPFSMLTYEDTRPWATMMKMAVTQKVMPPWFADPHYGHFSNERSLTAVEIRTLAAWVNGGAQKGSATDLPPPPKTSSKAGASQLRTSFSNSRGPLTFPLQASWTINTSSFRPASKRTNGCKCSKFAQPTERSSTTSLLIFASRVPTTSRIRSLESFLSLRPRKPTRRSTRALCPAIFWSATLPDNPRKFSAPAKASSSKQART